jgi:hypothetical protein
MIAPDFLGDSDIFLTCKMRLIIGKRYASVLPVPSI